MDPKYHDAVKEVDLAVVIPAQDEAYVLGNTLRSLGRKIGPRDQIHVIADHCQDATAAVAKQNGAHVHIRSDNGPVGKGPAINWWLIQTSVESSSEQVIVILDADTQVAPGFFKVIRDQFERGAEVVQTRIEPSIPIKNPIALLSSLSEIVEQRVYDALRNKLKWPIRLRGTGMAFRRSVLEKFSDRLHTVIEDVELTVLLGAAKVPITLVSETYVIDPRPEDEVGAVHQRARWLKGQFHVLLSYPYELLRLLTRGPSGWSLLGSVLLKPKTLIFPIKIALFSWAWLMATRMGDGWLLLAFVSLFGAGAILFECAALLYGLSFVNDKRSTLYALVVSPVYLLLWLKSLFLALASKETWLRSRSASISQPMSETGSVP